MTITFTPRQKVTEPLEEFADARKLPVNLLTQHFVYVDEDVKPGWTAFTYRNLTGVWGTRYRRPESWTEGPKYWQPPGSAVHLYNPQRLGPDAEVVVITEGETDTLTALAAGQPAVGIPGVHVVPGDEDAPRGRFQRAWLTLYEDARVIVLALDNDPAGERAAGQLAMRWSQSKRLSFPEGVNDLNDWWRQDREEVTGRLKEMAA